MKSFDIDKYNSRECQAHNHGFYLGEQSKQAEVDELRKNLNNALKTIEIQQRFLDDADGANKILTSQASELQKRIDEINKLVDLWREDYVTLVKYDDGNRYCLEDCINRVVNILKGDQS